MSLDIEKTIRKYLPHVIHMSLGTSKDNKPWVCEVHFAFDDSLNLYFGSKTATRHCRELAENPQVAGNIVRQHQNDEVPLGVYFEGTAEEIKQEAAQKVAFSVLDKRFDISKRMGDKRSGDGWGMYKITVKNWYVFGKLQDEGGPQKYQLAWSGDGKNE